MLNEEENIDADAADPNNIKKKSKSKDSTKEPASKKRKLEHLEPTKDSSLHQTIIFHELNNITSRFEELHKVFGEELVVRLKDHASFFTQNNQNGEG